jgi:hypothetical protein
VVDSRAPGFSLPGREALRLIAGLTFGGFGKPKPPSGVIVGMMEHTGGRVERERCRAAGAFWQFATRAVSASTGSPLELGGRDSGGRTSHRAADRGSRTTSACSHAFGAKTARSFCSPAC